jgi:hypothetical protein
MKRQVPDFSAFPNTVRVGTAESGVELKMQPTDFAVHHTGSAPPFARDTLPGENMSIYPVERYDEEVHGAQPVPVYSSEKGGSVSVPTGLIFVRLSPNLTLDDRARNFADAGYELAKALSYAPNAGWLRAKSGNVASALANAANLNAVTGVEHVEPQMLTKTAQKR